MTKLEENMYVYVESAGENTRGAHKVYEAQVCSEYGKIALKYWGPYKSEYPKTGDLAKLEFYDVENASNELATFKSISLNSSNNKPYYCECYVVDEKEIPEKILNKIKKDRKKQFDASLDVLKNDNCWRDKNNHKFVISVLEEYKDKFFTAPAAVNNHHNYKGGLFIHTSEVFNNCLALIENSLNSFYKEEIDVDVVYTAAWLHDIGKIETYFMEEESPKLNKEKEDEIGHSTISNLIFVEQAKKYKLSEEFINKVSHCILAHHSLKEWNAVVLPKTKEAHLVCCADLASSKISV